MIGKTSIIKHRSNRYFISVQLKKKYHTKFAKLTGSNIGNRLAIVYKDKIISPFCPRILTTITGGRFQIGPFKKRKQAKDTLQQIT
jgi:preprotein translocase subunit SecD